MVPKELVRANLSKSNWCRD